MVSTKLQLTVRKLFTRAFEYGYVVGASMIDKIIGLQKNSIESWIEAAFKCIAKIKGEEYRPIQSEKYVHLTEYEMILALDEISCTDVVTREDIAASPKLTKVWNYLEEFGNDIIGNDDYIEEGKYVSKWYCGFSQDGVLEEFRRMINSSYEFKNLNLGEWYACECADDERIVYRYSVFQEVLCQGEVLGYVGFKPVEFHEQYYDTYLPHDVTDRINWRFEGNLEYGWFFQKLNGDRVYFYNSTRLFRFMMSKILHRVTEICYPDFNNDDFNFIEHHS